MTLSKAKLVIVPNTLRNAIHAAIDKALAGRPCDDASREIIYYQILAYYDDHGRLPDFTLKEQAADAGEEARGQ